MPVETQGNTHQKAFGISFDRNNTEQLQQWCNKQLEGRDLTPVFHVDLEIEVAKLKNRHIEKVGKLMSTFGGKGMEKPQFVVKNIVIDSADIQRLGKTSTMLKFSTNINGEAITFVRPYTSTEVYKEMICETVEKGRKGINRDGVAGNKKIELTIIGEFQINSFNGKDYPQIVIKEFESKLASQSRGRRERKF